MQWVCGLALGHEDLNDHEEIRRDPLQAVLAERPDPTGEKRVRERERSKALAGPFLTKFGAILVSTRNASCHNGAVLAPINQIGP
jgi:hypothetical protein